MKKLIKRTHDVTITERLYARRIVIALALALLALPGIVFADEAWGSNYGRVEWEKNVEDTAVFKLETPEAKGAVTRLFIGGLLADPARDSRSYRGYYRGYWTDDSGKNECEASLVDPLKNNTRNWGILEIAFAENPSGRWDFTARLGTCFDRYGLKIIGRALNDEGSVEQGPKDPAVRMAEEVSMAFVMRALDNLEESYVAEAGFELVVADSLGDESVNKQMFPTLEFTEFSLKRSEVEPGFPNRSQTKLEGCGAGVCTFKVEGLMHNTLFMKKIAYRIVEGKPKITAIYIIDGN
ncbi:MAG: hypothetical protein J5I65_00360 [Aridibacter famidurans]|nr:hypothetical protein [Aridibacter famidurans]